MQTFSSLSYSAALETMSSGGPEWTNSSMLGVVNEAVDKDLVFHGVSDPVFFPGSGSPFFLSPDPDRPIIRIRSGKIRIRIREKKRSKIGK